MWSPSVLRQALRAVPLLTCIAGPLVLAGCGFQPLYGTRTDQASGAELSSIRINPIQDRIGQQLRNQLIDQIQPRGAQDVRYTLDVKLAERRSDLSVLRDASTTIASVTVIAEYTLTNLRQNAVVLRETISSEISYTALAGGFTTLVSESDAREKATRQVGDQIATRLSLFFTRNRPQ